MTLLQILYRLVFFIIVSAVINFNISAQKNKGASDELKSKANELFEKDQYTKAFPLFSQLLSLDRNDHELQYRFGVCLLYSDRSDTYAPIKYLNKALNHIETPDIYYHLGFANHVNYNFPTAISFYKEYQSKVGKKQKKSFDVERKIEMCQNGIGMMRSVKDLFVLSKSEVSRDDFFRSYELQDFSGQMIQKPEEFMTKEDEKQNKTNILFFNSKATEIYYSAYAQEHKKQKDIYKRVRTEEGGWSLPIRLTETINTPYDEDYPVLMPDGITLYFSSKGHNTMGGYDIFKTVYNQVTDSWSQPENINFPFNTPVDDILFVPDTQESTAWFASVRNSVDEKIMVYKVGIVKRPGGSEDLAAIYKKNQELTEADLRTIKERALLEVNISEKDYEDLEETEADPLAQSNGLNQQNLDIISEILEKKNYEQVIIDSAKYYVNSQESNIKSFDSLSQKTSSLAASIKRESERIKDEVKSNLKRASLVNNIDDMKKAVDMANKQMFKAERLDYHAAELDDFEREIKQKIVHQREAFIIINSKYGDAEQAIINGSQDSALAIINSMDHIWEKVPRVKDVEGLQTNDTAKSIISIQYPNQISQEELYRAFAINEVAGQAQIESFNERYDAFIPKIENMEITAQESEFSNHPYDRLQEYLSTLGEVRKSADIKVNEINKNIDEISSEFQNLPEDEKQSQIDNLNQLEKEKRAWSAKSEWMTLELDEKQNQLIDLQSSTKDVDSKLEIYQSLNSELEQNFDFDNRIFKKNAVIPTTTAITTFGINSSGGILVQSTQPKVLTSSELVFNADNKRLIESQTLQMLVDSRKLQKENQFLQRKVNNRIIELETLTKETFREANQLLANSRQSAEKDRPVALEQANTKFIEAANQNAELAAYQNIESGLSQAISDQNSMINSLEEKQDEIGSSLSKNDLGAAKSFYKDMEQTYQSSKAIGDFSSKIAYDSGKILSNEDIKAPELVLYQITANGAIVKTIGDSDADWDSFESFSNDILNQSTQPKVLTSSELVFNADNKRLIESQTLQMLVDSRKLQKENQFLQRKVNNRIIELETLTKETFREANQLLANSRQSAEKDRPVALEQANTKFKEAANQNAELAAYQNIESGLSQAISDQNSMINSLEEKQDEIGSSLSKNDLGAAKSFYKDMEQTYQSSKAIGDFSSKIAYDSGKILSNEDIKTPELVLYQITANGAIIKTIGDSDADYDSFESFSNDIANPVITNFMIAPTVSLNNRQTQFVDIFSPQSISEDEQIERIASPIPTNVSSSEDSLMKKTVGQINNLESKANDLINNRNQINSYYLNTLTKAEEFENESLLALSTPVVTKELIDKANAEALLSKTELYKASEAANIIRQYDEKILQYTNLITKYIDAATEMNNLINDGKQNDAVIKSVQLQRDYSTINDGSVDDSKFNFAVNEMITELPEIFLEEESQEFMLADAQVQRNDQAKLSQFFYRNAYPVKTQFTDNNLISFTSNDNSIQQLESSPLSQVQQTTTLLQESDNENSSLKYQKNNDSLTAVKAVVSMQSFSPDSLKSAADFRGALSELNTYAQNHMAEIDQKTSALILLAESKLLTSNNFSLEAEKASNQQQKSLQDSAKTYLYQAISIKKLLETFETYVSLERAKQEQLTQTTIQIESKLIDDDIIGARDDFKNLQQSVGDLSISPSDKLTEMSLNMQKGVLKVQNSMDSAYDVSQLLANKSVQYLSEAADDREKAESKRSAYKRREYLRTAEEKELEATRLQNESEKALATGNQMYQEKEVLSAFALVALEMNQLQNIKETLPEMVVNRDVIFESIERRKAEVLEGQLSTTIASKPLDDIQNTTLAQINDVQLYHREYFKAEMIKEELDLLKREIALMEQSNNQSLSERETYVINQKIKSLHQKADSIEIEANKAFDFANRVLESLPSDAQKQAQGSNRNFDTYLSNLKTRIEILLSEAASLKQRAQRSNNIEAREDIFNQAKDKEEVAMYLILEEFEVIAQKNRTRYRRNQLILEQLLMEQAIPEERELMRNIFTQIDDYFDQAALKREKANQKDISFNMKKILLQDAYSLEMKALDLQQQAKTMIENSDRTTMMAYQKNDQDENLVAQQTLADTSNTLNQLSDNENTTIDNNNEVISTTSQQKDEKIVESEVPMVENNNTEGVYYRVQFVALKELKNTNDFPGIAEVRAQQVTGTDFIRYFSGQFNNLDDAIIRRNSIRASGYADAFIKSWRNGEVVNLLSLNDGNTKSTATPTANLTTETQINNIDFSAANISTLPGVYYTVQVGIYSRPRTSAMIFNIAPLYHKRMDNGYWIYYSGIFKSIANAENKKQEIIQKGVSDAFIVAFSNGNQVNLAEARQQINRGEETPAEDDIVILEDASSQLNQQWSQSQSNTTVNEDNKSEELVYKVQVGVYSNPVNLNWISSQLDNDIPVKSFQNSNGKYVYTVGEFSSVNEARALLKEVSELVSDAFLVGFQNEQKKYIR